MNNSFKALYTSSQTAELDKLAIEKEGIPAATLMRRAGSCAFNHLMSTWPDTKKILVVCGVGNNGGDGYVIARLAKLRKLEVHVIQLGDISHQSDVSRNAMQEMEKEGVLVDYSIKHEFNDYDVIIDALLGIGIKRNVSGEWLEVIEKINLSTAKVVSIDVPSGLAADTGKIMGAAVVADITITYIARKQGLYTADGKSCCGVLKFDALDIPSKVYAQHIPSSYLIDELPDNELFCKRLLNTHKGSYGHVLIIGGALGMSGAVRMAATAALRSGCGLVSVATHPDHASLINSQNPEIMSHAVLTNDELDDLFDVADIIVVGPGLGNSEWSEQLFLHCLSTNKPLVIDADGLRLLAKKSIKAHNWILTPHPGEAAALLGKDTKDIQSDRFAACRELNKRYGGIVVLKGAGTLIGSQDRVFINSSGNPGLATAGTGDVLSGIIAGFMAQARYSDIPREEIVSSAVYVHGLAGDLAVADSGEIGLLATDLYPYIRKIINHRV